MKVLELKDHNSRFRFAESCIGLLGCLCISFAVWTPNWLSGRGLWAAWNDTDSDQEGDLTGGVTFRALEAERVFAVVSVLMAVSAAALCLVFALCWTAETVRSYSNTRALLMAGQALYPTTLLLLTLAPTGFFFLLSWSLFTYQHREEISQDWTHLGSSYWFGALGWALLLVVIPVVFLVEQCIVPDILPDLEKSVELWRASSPIKYSIRSYSAGYCSDDLEEKDNSACPLRYMPSP